MGKRGVTLASQYPPNACYTDPGLGLEVDMLPSENGRRLRRRRITERQCNQVCMMRFIAVYMWLRLPPRRSHNIGQDAIERQRSAGHE